MTTLTPTPIRTTVGLDGQTLRHIVDAIVQRPDAWQPLVGTPTGERIANLLRRDEQLEIWVISWAPGHDTGFHDHGGSTAAVAVARGELVEERLRIDSLPFVRLLRTLRPAIAIPADHVHRVRQVGGPPAVSVHAYSPPLTELGAYNVGAAGVLERSPVAGSTMLQPIVAAPANPATIGAGA
jgi:predicted metal-dependent enzyme (double-stranded beta helix superfamily)